MALVHLVDVFFWQSVSVAGITESAVYFPLELPLTLLDFAPPLSPHGVDVYDDDPLDPFLGLHCWLDEPSP